MPASTKDHLPATHIKFDMQHLTCGISRVLHNAEALRRNLKVLGSTQSCMYEKLKLHRSDGVMILPEHQLGMLMGFCMCSIWTNCIKIYDAKVLKQQQTEQKLMTSLWR